MNKKIILALAAIGFGFSINASAGWNSDCRWAQMQAERYCNVEMDQQLCSYWIQVVKGCGLPLEI